MFLYFRCWSSYKSSIPAPQGHLGRIYVVDRDRKKNAKVERKLKEVVNCEMENAELRFTDL